MRQYSTHKYSYIHFVLSSENHSYSEIESFFWFVYLSPPCNFESINIPMCADLLALVTLQQLILLSFSTLKKKNERFRATSPHHHHIFFLDRFQCQFTIQSHIHTERDTVVQHTGRHIQHRSSYYTRRKHIIQFVWCLIWYD